ncbi:MAG: hypothetical protein WBA73_16155 [Devosia sp.]
MTTVNVRGVSTPFDEQGQPLPRRSNLWAVRVGFWFGRGHSATSVAAIVGEGTSAGTVAGQVRRAGLLEDAYRGTVIPFELPSWQRNIIAEQATRRGLSMQQIIHQVLESTLVLDDLYNAVTDGRYDDARLSAKMRRDIAERLV